MQCDNVRCGGCEDVNSEDVSGEGVKMLGVRVGYEGVKM